MMDTVKHLRELAAAIEQGKTIETEQSDKWIEDRDNELLESIMCFRVKHDPPKKLECWANEYENAMHTHSTKERAENAAGCLARELRREATRTAVHLREVPTPEEIERFRSVITNDGLVFKSDYDALLRAYVGEVE